jgi:hypothetical protein
VSDDDTNLLLLTLCDDHPFEAFDTKVYLNISQPICSPTDVIFVKERVQQEQEQEQEIDGHDDDDDEDADGEKGSK